MKHGHKVAAINHPAFGHFDPGEGGQCGVPVHRARDGVGNGATFHAQSGAPSDGGHADAGLEGGELAAAQFLRRIAAGPAAVVRGIDDEGVVIEFILFQRIHNAADMVVQFLNRITVFAPIGFPLEGFADP